MCFNLCPLSLDLSLCTENSLAPSSFLLSGIYAYWLDFHSPPPKPSFIQDEKYNLSQPLLTSYAPSLTVFVVLCWTYSSKFIFLLFRSSDLDPEVQVLPHQCWTEGKNCLLSTLFLIQPRTKRAYCWLMVSLLSTSTLRLCFSELLSSRLVLVLTPPMSQCVMVCGAIPPCMQDLAFPLVELHNVPVSPFLQHVEVPLNWSTTIWCISRSSQFCTICKLSDGALYPTIHVMNEEVKEYWPQYPVLHH